jgi:hypothetical protein
MKKCSPSLAIKEMQIKTMLRFHLTPDRVNNKQQMSQGCGEKNPHSLLAGV